MNQLIDEIMRRYDITRYKNEQLHYARVEEIEAKIPEILRLHEEIRKTRMLLFRTQEDAPKLLNDIDQYTAQIHQLLKEKGYPENYLEPIYRCELCRDTGTNEVTKERCSCFQKALLHERYKELNIDKDDASFEHFDSSLFSEDILPNGISQKQNILQIRNRCEKFADNYPNTEKLNIIFTGKSGMGKTYLLKCVAKRLAARSLECLFISGYKLFDSFLKYHLDELDSINDFYDIPILIIDDLGTEPLVKNVTSEYLFSLLNERMKNKLHTLFATNFSPNGLIDRYGDRIVSRMLSVQEADVYSFIGKDIRLVKNKK